MKLNPPASSSDLDAARAVARRLHRRAQGHERATDEALDPPAPWQPVPAPAPAAALSRPEPAPAAPHPPEPVAAEASIPEPTPPARTHERSSSEATHHDPMPFPPAVAPEPEPFHAAPAIEPEPTPAAASPPETTEPAPAPAEPGPFDAPEPPAFGDESLFEAGALEETPGLSTPPLDQRVPDSALPEGEDDALSALTDPGDPTGPGPPAGGMSAEDLVGEPETPWGEGGSLDVGLDAEPERAPDDLITAPPPAWDDIADSCMLRARAHGAMMVDPTGQVMTARGEWPEPGPEAIGGRLVSMMEKTLHDAPTRSVSAPLAGEHLTAWRVPIAEGYLTVVFMAESPLGNDARDRIDGEIRQALGE